MLRVFYRHNVPSHQPQNTIFVGSECDQKEVLREQYTRSRCFWFRHARTDQLSVRGLSFQVVTRRRLSLSSFQFVCGRVGSSSTCNLLEGVYCLSKTPSLLDLKWIKALRIKHTYYSIESVAKAGHSASAHAQTLSPWIPSQKHLVAG